MASPTRKSTSSRAVKKQPAKPLAAAKSPAPKSIRTEPSAPVSTSGTHLTGTGKILSSKMSYKGKVFSVNTEKVTEPGGVTSVRDVVRHSGSVVVLAVDSSTNPADPTILLERQYRHAAGKFLLELPAGRIEPGEAPLAAAKRELIEETGFRARRWSRLVRYYASPGFLAEHMQVFLAEDIRAGIATPEEDERIELMQVPLSDVLQRIEAGKIEDAKTILSVLLFARTHQ